MFDFPTAPVAHAAGNPSGGDAAHRVLTAADIEAAAAVITGWEGYAATPLVSLPALARAWLPYQQRPTHPVNRQSALRPHAPAVDLT